MLLLKKERPRKRPRKNNPPAGSWLLLFLGCAFFICVTSGCKETPPPPEKSEVVHQKIATQKGTKAKAVQQKTTPPESQQPTTQPVLEEAQKIITEQESESPVYFYDPAGKIDPFRPIFVGRAHEGSPGSKKRVDKTIPLTPLQKININQVKVVGIIESPNGNRAMVQDASGKGYILTKGAYIGTNFGKVAKILRNKIIIHEEIEDYISGKIEIQEVTLELPQKYESGSMQ